VTDGGEPWGRRATRSSASVSETRQIASPTATRPSRRTRAQRRLHPAQVGAGHDRRPVEAPDGQVLADEAGAARVALRAERLDQLERVEADGALGAAVMAAIALAVAVDTIDGHPRGPDRSFRHPAARHVDLDHASLRLRIQVVPLPPGLPAFVAETGPIRNGARPVGPGYHGLLPTGCHAAGSAPSAPAGRAWGRVANIEGR
jgi:hypothetical protein